MTRRIARAILGAYYAVREWWSLVGALYCDPATGHIEVRERRHWPERRAGS